jgi:hypothetical protein
MVFELWFFKVWLGIGIFGEIVENDNNCTVTVDTAAV